MLAQIRTILTSRLCFGIVAVITPFFFVVGVIASFLVGGSWSLFTDSFHLLGDGIPFIAMFFFQAMVLSGDERRDADRLVAYINLATMCTVGSLSVKYGFARTFDPLPVTGALFYFAIVELVGNVLQLTFKLLGGKGHLSGHTSRALTVHLALDVIGSLLVVGAGAIIYWHLNLYRYVHFDLDWGSADGYVAMSVGLVTIMAGLYCFLHGHTPDVDGEHDHRNHGHSHSHSHRHEHVHHRGVHPGGEGDDRLFWTQQ